MHNEQYLGCGKTVISNLQPARHQRVAAFRYWALSRAVWEMAAELMQLFCPSRTALCRATEMGPTYTRKLTINTQITSNVEFLRMFKCFLEHYQVYEPDKLWERWARKWREKRETTAKCLKVHLKAESCVITMSETTSVVASTLSRMFWSYSILTYLNF